MLLQTSREGGGSCGDYLRGEPSPRNQAPPSSEPCCEPCIGVMAALLHSGNRCPSFSPSTPFIARHSLTQVPPTLSLLTHSASSHPILPCIWIHTVLCLFSFEALLLECYLLIPHTQTPPVHSSGPSSLHSFSSFSGNESILPEPL